MFYTLKQGNTIVSQTEDEVKVDVLLDSFKRRGIKLIVTTR